MCDEILKQAVEGISDLITTPGVINIDFADIRSIMENAGSALMGIGTASGEKRAEEAAKNAINSPLLELSIHGAKGVLFSIAGGDDLTMFEIQDAAKVITESIDPNAKVIFGTVRDEKIKKGEIKITVIASGFPEAVTKRSLFGNDSVNSEEKEKKSKIFNTIINPTAPVVPKELPPKPVVEEKKTIEEVDDDWGAVPAFLRRAKK
jgi:cell division protein FtsZ